MWITLEPSDPERASHVKQLRANRGELRQDFFTWISAVAIFGCCESVKERIGQGSGNKDEDDGGVLDQTVFLVVAFL